MTTEKHLDPSNSVFLEMNVGLNFRGLTALFGSENELGNSNLFPFFFSLLKEVQELVMTLKGEGFLQVRYTWCHGKINEVDNRFSLMGLGRLPELFSQTSEFWGKEKALSLLSVDLGLDWIAGIFHLASKIPTARI